MALMSGTRLGPYEILSPIGSGGMGEIFKAKDTRLDRVVAIKVISPLVAGSSELRERFEREARAVSQLNHPHICTLHDIGSEQGTEYLVLEFLDGESLAERLRKGPLPLEQGIALAIQVCDALDKAHRAGIVHRDLKPGNVFLVRGASASAPPTAKLLDFGLAKSAPAATVGSGSMSLTSPPTATTPLTAQGTILGTFQYMAPEQLEGAEADTRTDIWAFGCVFYEMLTGRKAFDGRTHANLISAIMASQPAPLADTVSQAPPVLDQVVRTCLAKDPAERFQTAHDLLLQLRWIAGGSGATPAIPVARPHVRGVNRFVFGGVMAATAIAAGSVTWLLTRPAPPAPRHTLRTMVTLPPKTFVGGFGSSNLALSPDGMKLVYVGSDDTSSSLFVRDLSQFEAGTPLSGTADALMPFFSPDGNWVGFFLGNTIRKVPLSGGAPMTICAASPYGAAWAPDDTIIFADSLKAVIVKVPASGGTPVPVTQLEAGETGHRWPALLPDGSVLFTANAGTNWSESRLVVQPAGGGARKTVVEAGTSARYLPTGHLAFIRNAALYVVPFDVATLSVTGQPRQIAQSLTFNEGDGRVQLAVSPAGTLAYAVSPPAAVARSLVWVDREGRVQPVGLDTRAYEHPRISPDGRSVAVTIREANPDVWVADPQRKTLTRFTFDPAEDESPVWSPDGARITYASTRAGKPRATYWKAADNSGVEAQLFTTKTHQHLAGWTPDGKTLVSEEFEASSFGIYAGTLGTETATPLIQTTFAEVGAQLSPDGKWIAYSSNEGGQPQVFAQAFPGGGSRVQISTAGGAEPRWARNGRELFYRLGDRMLAVPIEYAPSLRAGTPRVLFEGAFTRIGWGQANYDVAADGRFLMVKGQEEVLPTIIHLVVNWFDELAPPRP